jgi:hypothetical protein
MSAWPAGWRGSVRRAAYRTFMFVEAVDEAANAVLLHLDHPRCGGW